jgi:ATP-dependent DNA helicase RecG
LAHQSAIVLSRQKRNDVNFRRVPRVKKYDLLPKFRDILPFELTGAQNRTISEIYADMERDIPMMRLVQGDVGSGKTIVAMAAAIKMAEMGGQTAIAAPTDTLAQQHFAKLKPMCDKIGIVCDILTGRDKGVTRREKLISLRSGRTKLVVGTHALFSEDVEYHDLGLVIIDEQHRFGVAQREALRQKGKNPDLLALSATPIPRTLSMTIYGDMDISLINEKPAGRLPIKTTKLPMDRVGNLVAHIRPQIARGAKVFWICPLVQESEESDMTAVQTRFQSLRTVFPNVGLVHGQMDKKQRDTIMARFADNNSGMNILVATTVIEVGIDVPHATIIVIENAERFGLAALHQLRGRVGRGNEQSYCILLHGNNLSDDGLKRLNVLCETDDGFLIAEQDLMMRGVGELLGTRQSGWIQYHFVNYRDHRDLFRLAATAARDNTIDEWSRDLMMMFDCGVNVGA